jgi:hypothetical protein
MWGILKDKVYSNNRHTEDNLKESIQDVVSSVSPAQLPHAMNMFFRHDTYLQAKGNHFQHLL